MVRIKQQKIKQWIALIIGFGFLFIVFQNFTTRVSINDEKKKDDPSLNDAVAQALQSSENDNKASQVALQVDGQQIKKAYFKKEDNTEVLILEDQMKIDSDVGVGPTPHGVDDDLQEDEKPVEETSQD
ncbi:MAG: hypothetical protein H6623_01440 [Bdellovibrionaceae bacterium]|nr:hypothetical protein [Pseudobdellovibrionaceae bacterium]